MILLLSFAINSFSQSSINIVRANGGTQTFSLTATSKVYFSDSNLMYNETGLSVPISDIIKLTFTLSTSTEDVGIDNNSNVISVYPNPASDYIALKNLPEKSPQINIYSTTGVLIVSFQMNSSSETINVSALPKGVYLVKVNSLTAKFIKL
ncbi:MAG: T9SS type A sorting domain-containing protein [Paludibacteraceae bacterium]